MRAYVKMNSKKRERMSKKIKKNKTVIVTSILTSFLGIICVLVKLYFTSKTKETANPNLLWSLTELVGLTLFTSGVFTIILQTNDWTNYFEDRLTELVMNQNYLNSLNEDQLQELQIKTIKAFYKNDTLDKEGSFLNYFQENLSNFIKEPYRDSVKSEICVEGISPDGFWIYDHLTYRCRKVGNSIQDSVKWITEGDEYSDLKELKIWIENKNTKSELLSVKKIDTEYEVQEYPKKSKKCSLKELLGKKFTLSLKNHNEDNLLVTIESRYKIKAGNFSTWVMAHPTRGFYLTIRYPETLKLYFQTMLLHPESVLRNEQNGFFSMQYDEWLLPNSGVVYSFSS